MTKFQIYSTTRAKMATGGVEDSIKQHFCSNCEEPCIKCNETRAIAESAELFCDSCVVANHIKKDHPIVDYRNQVPDVCTEHKQLCANYCTTCEEVFCAKCLKKHRKHDFMSLNQKATKVRVKIFELLPLLEKNEKEARKKSEIVSSVVAKLKLDADERSQIVEAFLEEIKLRLTDEIQSQLRGFQDFDDWSKHHVQNIGTLHAELRNLLSQSNGSMISKFPLLKSKSCGVFDTNCNLNLLSSPLDGLNGLILEVIRDFGTVLELIPYDSRVNLSHAPSKFFVGLFHDECFEVEQCGEVLTVHSVDYTKYKLPKYVAGRTQRIVVENVYFISRFYSMSFIIIVFTDNSGRKQAMYVDINHNQFFLTSQFLPTSYPNGLDVLGPCCSSGENFDWIIWDPNQKLICLWNGTFETIWKIIGGFQARPSNKSVTSINWHCFHDQKYQTILAYDGNDSVIDPLYHNYTETIDCILSFIYEDYVMVTWSIQAKASSVYIKEFSKNSWEPHKRISLQLPEFCLYRDNSFYKPLINEDENCSLLMKPIDNDGYFVMLFLIFMNLNG